MKHKESSANKATAFEFLKDYPVGTITSLNANNTPESSVVYFFAQGDFSCFFVTKTQTRKYQNILARPNVTLLSFDESTLTSIELQGQVEPVFDIAEVVNIIEKFQTLTSERRSEHWIPPISQIEAGHYVVCRLLPSVVNFNRFSLQTTDLVLEQLTFNPSLL